jgi:hypothetical protein
MRIWNRPMIGISGFSDFNAEIAEQLGVPVQEGARLDDLVDGMGAQKAGLKKNDILVEVAGKPITTDFSSFAVALQGKVGGDVVEVVFYRGPKKKTISMELSKRPEPEIPLDPEALGKLVRKIYDEAINTLEQHLEEVSERVADHKASPKDWSIKEVLAHLIHTERNWAINIAEIVGGYPRWADDWGGNIEAHIQATITAYPTVPALLDELKANITEVVALASALPKTFLERKSDYFNTAYTMINIQNHILSHIDQIDANATAARNQ